MHFEGSSCRPLRPAVAEDDCECLEDEETGVLTILDWGGVVVDRIQMVRLEQPGVLDS